MSDALAQAIEASEPSDGLAHPIDFGARYGLGLRTGLSLGGGGVFFVAWQTAYLHEMAERGIDLRGVECVVGTSAGSLVAAVLGAGKLSRLHTELGLLGKAPKLLGSLAPVGDLWPSQVRARDRFGAAGDAEVGTIREIGHAALAAQTPGASVMSRNVALILGTRRWPSPKLQLTCVDAYSGERCVVTHRSGVRIDRAVAASSAVPGLFAPQPVRDRRCMDGGVSGTGVHLDLLAGARRAVVLGLTDGEGVDVGAMTVTPGSVERELDRLRGSGTEVFFRVPESMELDQLMDPAAVPDAVAMARRQASTDADALAAFLAA